MRFSQESFYGIAVMVVLARHGPDRPAGIEEISGAQDLPRSFVAKILQKLVRGGLVGSFRGRQRGYALALPPEQITVKRVLEVTEGAEFFHHCMFGRVHCDTRSVCFLHEIGMAIRADVAARLSQVSLADLAQDHRVQGTAR